MIKHFLGLEWKQYIRSSHWQKSMALNILLVFFALYFVGMFLLLGVGLLPILKKLFPDQDPFIIANTYIFYWLMVDLLMRFFLQKLPVMSVKPLLILPVKRSKILHYVLGKSAVSFFNFLPLFAIIPFSVMLIIDGFNQGMVLTWMATMIIIVLIINFLNFIIEALSAESDYSFLPLLVTTSALFALDYFEIVNFKVLLSNGILAIADNGLYIVVPILLLVLVYVYNYKILKTKLYFDNALKTKITEVKTSELNWTRRFGDIAPFMQLDLKLIWRNKRTKSMVMLLVIGLLYGLFFYPQKTYMEMEFMYAFIGVFSTGFFLINFGQFIPAWDSAYYKLLMSQNIKYEQYLRSKFILMILSVAILFVLGIPYVYFGWKILLVHFVAAIYNIGVNTHVIMFGGSFNRKKIELDKKAAFNYQGTGAVQWLIGLPLMLLPMALFGITNWLIGFEVAVTVLGVFGVLGIVFHKNLMKAITQKYLNSKYKMISAFEQDN